MNHLYWPWPGYLAGSPGPQRVTWDPFEMKACGIGGIVSLVDPGSTRDFRLAGIQHLPAYMAWRAAESEQDYADLLEYLKPIFRFIDQVIADEEAVVVHCQQGCDRTGLVISAYLIWRWEKPAGMVIDILRAANPEALGGPGFETTVRTLETRLRLLPPSGQL